MSIAMHILLRKAVWDLEAWRVMTTADKRRSGSEAKPVSTLPTAAGFKNGQVGSPPQLDASTYFLKKNYEKMYV